MDGIYSLAALSAAMFFGSYIVGSIPLAFTMSQNRLRLTSILGAGLLIGTALSVILPEGITMLIEAQSVTNGHPDDRQQSIELLPRLLYGMPSIATIPSISDNKKDNQGLPSDKLGDSESSSHIENSLHSKNMVESSIHESIGLPLIVGFIFMLFVDQATRFFNSGRENSKLRITATVGLLIHSAADGVALGSASLSSRSDIQFIVFFAIMLHKAPAAFGLVSFLLVEGSERSRTRRHLLAFSLSAPVTGILTFYILVTVNQESSSLDHATGLLMLFSGGTFLYVSAVHILPELLNSHKETNSSRVLLTVEENSGNQTLSRAELLTLVLGTLLPYFLTKNHSH